MNQTREMRILAASFASAGYTIFKSVGKQPARGLKWRQQPYTMPDEVVDYLDKWQGNYCLAPTKRQLVIDVDPRNFKSDDKPHLRLLKKFGIDIRKFTTTIQTGNDGLHLFLKLPSIPTDMKIAKNPKDEEGREIYPGVDFITEGAYVVGAGSIHPDTKRTYKLLDFKKISEIAECPQEMVDHLLTKASPKQKVKAVEEVMDGDEQTVTRYVEFLCLCEPAVEGANGDAVTYQVACTGRDFGMSAAKTLELIALHYNPRCEPEWSAEELDQKVFNAYNYATGAKGSKTAEADFDEVEVISLHKEWKGWSRISGTSKLAKCLNNVICQFINIHENPDNPLMDSLGLNLLSKDVMKLKWMPWDRKEGTRMPSGGVPWRDADDDDLRAYLSMTRRFDISASDVIGAIGTMSRWRQYHPVQDYIRAQNWDGTPRLETWLLDNTGLKDSGVNREISRITIMQAVARVFEEGGCQADIVTILEGAQGIGKSSIVRILGGQWFADVKIDPSNKDTLLAIQSQWIIEISEMAVTRKADAQELKAFITKIVDVYRVPYGRKTEPVPRQCVFIGTMNRDATGQYLDDSTGNRRYAPLDLREQAVDLKGIAAIRDQLFAEAYHKYMSGVKWHMTDKKLLQNLQEKQAHRQISDPYMDAVQSYIYNIKPHRVSLLEVWEKALDGSKDRMGFAHQRRIATCLRDLDYVNKTARIGNKAVRLWCNEEYREVKDEGLF